MGDRVAARIPRAAPPGRLFSARMSGGAGLQALDERGALVLSRSVYDQVRDKLSMPFRDLGQRTLKNIDRPLQVYAVDGDAAVRPRRRRWIVAGLAAVVLLIAAGGA